MNNLFFSTRLKLTLFYLAIVMIVSLSFSFIVYQSVGLAFHQRLGLIETRMRRMHSIREINFVEDTQAVKRTILISLFYTNLGIFIFAAGSGYWLSGKTLAPIEEAMDDQKRFVADASHELRTPLTGLKTSMEVGLRDKKLTVKKAKKIISDNLESVDEMQALANNLLNLAKYEQNGQQFNFEKINLPKVVDQAVKKIRPIADTKKIDIHLDLEDVDIQADKQSLEKMLIIFLDNAVKYTDRNGKIAVRITKKKKWTEVEISDTGIGIREENLPKIFNRFYQVDQSRTKKENHGFGLGLSVAKKIVDLHQGKIEVDSQVDKGTTFTIIFPLN